MANKLNPIAGDRVHYCLIVDDMASQRPLLSFSGHHYRYIPDKLRYPVCQNDAAGHGSVSSSQLGTKHRNNSGGQEGASVSSSLPSLFARWPARTLRLLTIRSLFGFNIPTVLLPSFFLLSSFFFMYLRCIVVVSCMLFELAECIDPSLTVVCPPLFTVKD